VVWFRLAAKAGDHQDHVRVRNKVKKLFQGTGASPRWVDGYEWIDFFVPSKNKSYPKMLAKEGGWSPKTISSSEAAEIAAETWLALHKECMRIISEAQTAEDINSLLNIPWISQPGLHRTGGGLYSREQLPWFSLAEARQIANEEALAKRGGVPFDCCGNEIEAGWFCREPLSSTLVFTPTGEKLGKRFRSMFSDQECVEYLDRSPIEESFYRRIKRVSSLE
jgi:hypothetical protein